MANFTLNELVQSNTAAKLGIDNTPDGVARVHLTELIRLLEDIRAEWAKVCINSPAIRVTSGYRCPELNKAVGGKKSSAHLLGYAADIQPSNGNQRGFEEFMAGVFAKKGYLYDQIIIEKSKTSRWVHVGLKNGQGQQRKQCFKINV
jgi:hypothetical protein